MYFVFDIETTGIPERNNNDRNRYHPYSKIEKYSNSRVVSIAWIILDKNYKEVSRYYSLIEPKGFDIPVSSTKIHGITTEYASSLGRPIRDVINDFETMIRKCKVVVSHNIGFDMNVLSSEIYRFKRYDIARDLNKMDKMCTMAKGKTMLGLSKYPKLAELYGQLFGSNAMKEHHALEDAINCSKCFVELMKS